MARLWMPRESFVLCHDIDHVVLLFVDYCSSLFHVEREILYVVHEKNGMLSGRCARGIGKRKSKSSQRST